MSDTYYRAVCTTDQEYPGEDDFYIEFLEYTAVKRTAKGVWIRLAKYDHAKPRFVLDNAIKRYAYPTKAEALKNFIYRKTRHIRIAESQLAEAKIALRLAKDLKIRLNTESGN